MCHFILTHKSCLTSISQVVYRVYSRQRQSLPEVHNHDYMKLWNLEQESLLSVGTHPIVFLVYLHPPIFLGATLRLCNLPCMVNKSYILNLCTNCVHNVYCYSMPVRLQQANLNGLTVQSPQTPGAPGSPGSPGSPGGPDARKEIAVVIIQMQLMKQRENSLLLGKWAIYFGSINLVTASFKSKPITQPMYM